MGFTCQDDIPNDPKQELITILETSTDKDPKTTKVVASAYKDDVFYFAVRITPRNPEEKGYDCSPYCPDSDGSYTIGVVVLTMTETEKNNWCYDILAETMGPHYANAPINLINELSDLKIPEEDSIYAGPVSWANTWRASCIAEA